jgi:hypothetical protein
MENINKGLYEYGRLLRENDLRKYYKYLIEYIMGLQKHFKEKYQEYEVQKNLYQGYLDLTFFTLTTIQTKQRDLKYAIVFIHDKMQFEVWLSGKNRTIMSKYHDKFSDYDLGNYLLTADEKGMSSIVVSIIVEDPNFDNLNELTNKIDESVISFINEIEKLLLLID